MVTFVRSRQACLIQRGMSALGQKQTFAPQKVMSALPPKADMCSATSRCPLWANSGHRAIQPETPKPRRSWSRTNQ